MKRCSPRRGLESMPVGAVPLVATDSADMLHMTAWLRGLSKTALIERCLALRPGKVETPLGAARDVLPSLARGWRDLSAEIKEHEALLTQGHVLSSGVRTLDRSIL